MAYSDKVIDHYENPRNVGSLPKDDANVGTGLVGAPECGDVMKLQIKVNVETGVIEDARFKTFGCGSAIASSSLATEWLKGKTVDEALAIKNTDIVEELALPPVKIHCSILAEDAIKAAVADYRKRHLPVMETPACAPVMTQHPSDITNALTWKSGSATKKQSAFETPSARACSRPTRSNATSHARESFNSSLSPVVRQSSCNASISKGDSYDLYLRSNRTTRRSRRLGVRRRGSPGRCAAAVEPEVRWGSGR